MSLQANKYLVISPVRDEEAYLRFTIESMIHQTIRPAEWIIVISLVLGIGTRYGAVLGLLFVVIATVTAHRWWGYPQAVQLMQYTFLVKNLAAAGGLILLFATGPGKISLDEKLKG